ncbi:hypothetical protein CLV71_11219 [Actinophytocola oryzae]|uniref:Uncharacterized protein n=1 Tax=Actinophytocola oryzae TaxID=502181 RepID=A0A4R7V8X6_9PSEU|nr:hypothetical protein CLV71_11219 [Actinophytocola oryzae]
MVRHIDDLRTQRCGLVDPNHPRPKFGRHKKRPHKPTVAAVTDNTLCRKFL